jgi:hypothetical protein
MTQFLRSPFFQAWHPDVLRSYVDNALYSLPNGNGEVALKMHPLWEAIQFNDTNTGSDDAWMNVCDLDEDIELRWVVPDAEKPQAGGIGPEDTRERVWLRPKNSSNLIVKGSGHLIVQEAPEALG